MKGKARFESQLKLYKIMVVSSMKHGVWERIMTQRYRQQRWISLWSGRIYAFRIPIYRDQEKMMVFSLNAKV